jgi:hypothetical protein
MERFVLLSPNTCFHCGRPLKAAKEGTGFEAFAENLDRAMVGGGMHEDCAGEQSKSKVSKAALQDKAEAEAFEAMVGEAKSLGIEVGKNDTAEEIRARIAEAKAG